MNSSPLTTRWLIPLLFVFLWSTGFIGAKYGLPYAEPITFLFVRMLIAATLAYIVAIAMREQWPVSLREYGNVALVGILIHGVYLGGIFYAISIGVDAGISALIVSLQPLITVILAAVFLSEPLSRARLAGIAAGLFGVMLVLGDRGISTSQINLTGVLFCIVSLFGISIGTVYQKQFCTKISLLPGICIQYTANCIFLLLIATKFETMTIHWTTDFVLALAWLVIGLSLGAVFLLMHLIKQGDAGQVASLFYLVPPFTAFEAWLLFNEQLSYLAVVGMIFCATGVALVIRKTPEQN